MNYQGQIGADKWVVEFFNGKKNGFFVEAGAGDGIKFSNTYVLEKDLGWTGICIEPNSMFAELPNNRKCQCVPYVLGGERKHVTFVDRGYHSSVIEPGVSVLKTIKTCSIPLGEVLEQFKAPYLIDYLSLDTEGSEYDILRTFPFKKHKFMLISVEHNNQFRLDPTDQQRQNSIRWLLDDNGYKLDRTVEQDDWFVFQG